MRDALLGRSATLILRELRPPHAMLATASGEAVSVPIRELPPGAVPGDRIPVFVTRSGPAVATTVQPRIERGEVAFLTATASASFGTFFDWGLGKELLVPFAEQTADVVLGARHPIGLVVDRSGRLAGTMRVAELLHDPCGDFALDQAVDGEAWRNDPEIGLFVIVGKRFVGLLPASEPHRLTRGEAARFRVSRVLADGRIVLTLRAPAHEEIDRDAERILAVLSGAAAPRLNDRSSPDELRERLGLAKKAFKRAAGRLLKQGAIELDGSGFYRQRR